MMYLIDSSSGEHGEMIELYLCATKGQVRHLTVIWDGNSLRSAESRQARFHEVDDYHRLAEPPTATVRQMSGDAARKILATFRPSSYIDDFAWEALVETTANPSLPST
jgi:hypothetical protein